MYLTTQGRQFVLDWQRIWCFVRLVKFILSAFTWKHQAINQVANLNFISQGLHCNILGVIHIDCGQKNFDKTKEYMVKTVYRFCLEGHFLVEIKCKRERSENLLCSTMQQILWSINFTGKQTSKETFIQNSIS